MRRCQSRHRKCWVVSGGYLLWCYECGAIRRCRVFNGNEVVPTDERWTYPVGPDGENPAMRPEFSS